MLEFLKRKMIKIINKMSKISLMLILTLIILILLYFDHLIDSKNWICFFCLKIVIACLLFLYPKIFPDKHRTFFEVGHLIFAFILLIICMSRFTIVPRNNIYKAMVKGKATTYAVIISKGGGSYYSLPRITVHYAVGDSIYKMNPEVPNRGGFLGLASTIKTYSVGDTILVSYATTDPSKALVKKFKPTHEQIKPYITDKVIISKQDFEKEKKENEKKEKLLLIYVLLFFIVGSILIGSRDSFKSIGNSLKKWKKKKEEKIEEQNNTEKKLIKKKKRKTESIDELLKRRRKRKKNNFGKINKIKNEQG